MSLNPRATQLRQLVLDFLNERLKVKLDKLGDDDPKRQALIEQHLVENWLAAAAKMAAQMQIATHPIKATHPSIKDATSPLYEPAAFNSSSLVGTHCLSGENYRTDFVYRDAKYLQVIDFLTREFHNKTLLQLCLEVDADLAAALSDDAAQAQAWMAVFAGLLEPKGAPSSHTLAKQVYWPVSDAVHEGAGFHLLQPLYASSLAHAVYAQVQEDRFGEAAKQAREAKKSNQYSTHPVRYYSEIAIQKIGGQTIQSQGNVSKLNQVRRGNNYLFASLPPQWQSQGIKPLLRAESLFGRFGRRLEVRWQLRSLLNFLKTDPPSVLATRERRARHVGALLFEFLLFTAELRELTPGWVAQAECRLKRHHAHWLDPQGAAQLDQANNVAAPNDVQETLSEDFALWFNHQLRDTPVCSLPVGDPEYQVWRKRTLDVLKAYERGGFDEAERVLEIEDEQTTTQQEATHV